jgi:hypothetical protein
MTTIIFEGRFGEAVALAIAAKDQGQEAHIMSWEQWQSRLAQHPALALEGTVHAIFSALNLDGARAVERQLGPLARLICCFAFERHVLVAPLSAAGSVCLECFGKRLLCLPPAPYGTEAIYLLSTLGARLDALQFQGFHQGIVSLAAQLCIQREASVLTPRTSTLFEINNVQINTSDIMPLHGCPCRGHSHGDMPQRSSSAGHERFSGFSEELASWMS